MSEKGGMLTTVEAARIRGVSRSTVNLAVKEGKLHAQRVPGAAGNRAALLFDEEEVRAWKVKPRNSNGEANGHVNGSAPKKQKNEDELSVLLDQMEGLIGRMRTAMAKRDMQIEARLRKDVEKETLSRVRLAVRGGLLDGEGSLSEG